MGKLIDQFDILVGWFTGKNKRHNSALGDTIDLSKAIEEFFTKYRLKEKNSDFSPIYDNKGQAKFDVTNITYRTRTIIKVAKDITGKKITPLLEEVYNDLEEVKRGIFTPELGSDFLRKSISNLHKSFKDLLKATSSIEFK